MKKRKIIFFILGALFLGLLVWRLQKTIHQKHLLATTQNIVVYPRVEVTTPMNKEMDEWIDTWGIVSSENSTIIYPKVSGIVLEERVQIGDFVKVNDTVAILDRNLQPQEYKRAAIVTPFSGVVTQRFQSVGSTVTPQTPIYQIESINQLKVICKTNQQSLNKIRLQQKVRITCNAFEGEEFWGTVSKIYPTADPNSHSAKIEISIHTTKLKPGMYVDAQIVIGRIQGLFLPVQAIYERSNETKVGVVRNNRVQILFIRAGKRVGNERLVEGISKQDTVITSGIDWLTDGDTVVVIGRSL
ncbi:MAG: efflux RND transporter periplasmic adaptor subunit [bacterium]|nr:efflux RND transporter periplasmic adaptor subunit [bacterium]